MEVSTNLQQESRQVVIDTQSVLDCWYFANPWCVGWQGALSAGGWRWLATSPMREELAAVLLRGFGPRWQGSADSVLAAFDAMACRVPAPCLPLAGGLRCSDPDDQKFIDLAVAARASHLVTRDRALLKLARQARLRHGLAIVLPSQWPAATVPAAAPAVTSSLLR